MLYDFAPWSTYAPRGLGDYYNPLQSDWATQFQPWILFARAAIHAGVFPAWNAQSLDGTPFFAAGQSAVLNPLSLPYWIAPLPLGYALGAWLQLFATALGTYLLVRELRGTIAGALLAGVAFGFGAWHVMWLSAPALVTPMTVLPWMLWRAECLLQRGRSRDGAWLALACAVCFLSGHPGNSAIAAAALVVYALARYAVGAAAPARRLVLLGVTALAVGAAISMAANLPGAKLVPGSAGEQARANGGVSAGLTATRTLFFPDWWRPPTGPQALSGQSAPFAPGNVKEITFYGGTVALLLAAIALSSRATLRERAPLAGLAYLGADMALNGPLRRLVLVHLPGYSNINMGRGIVLVQLAIALLAGLGLSDLLRQRVPLRRALAAAGVVVATALVYILTSQPGKLLDALRGQRPSILPAPDHDTLISVAAFFVLSGLALLVIVARPRVRPALVAGAMLALVVLDAGRVAQLGFRYFPPSQLAFPPATPAVRWLQGHAHGARIAAPQTALPPNTQMVYGLNSVQGYEAPEPDLQMFRLWQRVYPGQPYIFPLVLPYLAAPQRHLLNVLGARYLVTPAERPPIAARLDLGTAADGLNGTRRVYAHADALIYENPDAAPRVFVPGSVSAAPDDAQARDAVMKPSFRPPRDAVVEGGAPVAGRGTAQIVKERNSELDVQARMARAGLLVVNDRLKDGWSVTIDGHAAKPLRANAVMRGVVVPKGTHLVRWSYRVPGLRAGIALSVAGLIALVLWFAVGERVARYQNEARSMMSSSSSIGFV